MAGLPIMAMSLFHLSIYLTPYRTSPNTRPTAPITASARNISWPALGVAEVAAAELADVAALLAVVLLDPAVVVEAERAVVVEAEPAVVSDSAEEVVDEDALDAAEV